MSSLDAAHYADRAWHGTVTVLENVPVAHDTYRLRFHAPEIARRIVPGQFLMLRLAGYNDPLLGRPMALYDTVLSAAGEPLGLDVVYLALGKVTRRLARFCAGQLLDVWAPLGNGFPPDPAEHLVMVAGGIGQTPFLALAREFFGQRTYGDPPRQVPAARRITLCYGVRRRELLAGVDDFRRAGVDVRISSDDGSVGHHGLVTDLVREVLDEAGSTPGAAPAPGESARPAGSAAPGVRPACRIVCCGPEPMMAAVARLAAQYGVPCQVSLETPMACGIGICFSCVAKVRDPRGRWDYRRTCVEGPVFDAARIDFSHGPPDVGAPSPPG